MKSPQEPHNWRKSSRSANTSTCVEVGRIADGAAVRDTKNREAGHLTTTRQQWHTFLHAVKTDRFTG
ncbi:hypothetical protein GCM10027174_03590 [Salinifilum aidingensis]